MNNLFENDQWLLLIYILVYIPFKVHDFIKLPLKQITGKRLLGFLCTMLVCVIIVVLLYKDREFSIKDTLISVLIGMTWMQCIIDCRKEKSKRNLAFFFIFSAALVLFPLLAFVF